MNKQRKVLITVTYNEMGIIIDTKAEEVAQPNLQPICNQLATDTISRQAAIDEIDEWIKAFRKNGHKESVADACLIQDEIIQLPPADAVEIVRCRDCKHYQFADSRAFGFPVKRCEWTGFEDVDDEDFCSRGERKDGERNGTDIR